MAARTAQAQENEGRENVTKLRRKIKIDRPNPKVLLKEVRDYFDRRAGRLKVVKTTRTPSGQVLDWVDIRSQVRGGRIASPPERNGAELRGRAKHGDRVGGFELDDPRIARGPEGTVPIPRKSLGALRTKRSLGDYLSKHGRRTYQMMLNGTAGPTVHVPGSGSSHLYAFTSQSVTCYGGEGYLNIYDPYLQWSDEFSLQQIALSRGSGDGLQTLEGGWQEYRDLYGDWVPHLFVFYTTNGYTDSGDNKGGYNRDVDGWVQYSGSIYPEAKFSNHSVRGGSQYVFKIKYQLYEGNWWFQCAGEWIGYYPASLFNSSGLRSKADQVSFYGEIVDSSSHSGETHTDMGSGYFPDYGWTWSSYMRSLRYQSSTGGGMSTYNGGSGWASDTDLYDLITHMNSGGSWGSYFWLGGPGAG